MTTADFYILGEPKRSDRRVTQERARIATERSSRSRPKVEAETETRLWKLCAEVASPRLSGVEWIALVLLGASALGGLAYGFSELHHLFNSGALDETVRALLTN
jgi:hypothetical protein